MPQSKAQSDAYNLFRRLGINPTRQHLLEVLDGASYDAFLLLDEKPGLFDGNYHQHAWHRLMRIERNDPSSPLLDGLRRRDDRPPRPDRYGVDWGPMADSELCIACGQPDNCGDCNHEELSADNVATLKGDLAAEDQRVIDAELAAENRVDGPETLDLDNDTDAINEVLHDLGPGTEI